MHTLHTLLFRQAKICISCGLGYYNLLFSLVSLALHSVEQPTGELSSSTLVGSLKDSNRFSSQKNTSADCLQHRRVMKHIANNYTKPEKSLKGNNWYFLYATALRSL